MKLKKKKMKTNKESGSLAIKTEKGSAYDIPVEGSLGLLASGYLGIMAWREKRKGVMRKNKV